MASSCPKPLGLIHQQVGSLKDLNNSITGGLGTQDLQGKKIINVYGMDAQVGMNKCTCETMSGECQSKMSGTKIISQNQTCATVLVLLVNATMT